MSSSTSDVHTSPVRLAKRQLSFSQTPLEQVLQPFKDRLVRALDLSLRDRRERLTQLNNRITDLTKEANTFREQEKDLRSVMDKTNKPATNYQGIVDGLQLLEDEKAGLLLEQRELSKAMKTIERGGTEQLKETMQALGACLLAMTRKKRCERLWKEDANRLTFYNYLQVWLISFLGNETSNDIVTNGLSKQAVSPDKLRDIQLRRFVDPTQAADTRLAKVMLLMQHESRLCAGVETAAHQLATCFAPQLRVIKKTEDVKKLAELAALFILRGLPTTLYVAESLGQAMIKSVYSQSPVRIRQSVDDDSADLSVGKDAIEWLSDDFFSHLNETTVQTQQNIAWPIVEVLTCGGVQVGTEKYRDPNGGEEIYGFYDGDLDMVDSRRLVKDD